jgi:hypothetical protein
MVGVTDSYAPGMHVPVIVFSMAAYPVGIVHPVNPAAGRIVQGQAVFDAVRPALVAAIRAASILTT